MIVALLQVSGLTFPVDGMLARYDVEPTSIWQAGDPTRDGGRIQDHGFSISIPESATWFEAYDHITELLDAKADLLHDLANYKAHLELTVGVETDAESGDAAILEFPLDFMETLVGFGIHLNVSAYPQMD